MLIPILIIVLALVVLLLVVIALRPSEFSVSRSGTVAAPSDAVFEQVNDLHNWEGWSPWAKLDPAAKGTYEGPPAGVGASFAWAGNRNIGEGRMTITESRPYDLVRFKLDFLKPFKGTNTAEFTFKPDGCQTRVTWTMSGHNSFFAKAIGLIINCENMVGKQFEKGLEQLNLVAQTTTKSQAT